MREEEGRGIERELRQRMAHMREAGEGIEKHRHAMLRTYSERLRSRLQELFSAQVEPDRILQEAALAGGSQRHSGGVGPPANSR